MRLKAVLPLVLAAAMGLLVPTLGRAEFQVNAWTTGDQIAPAVAADAAGNFVVVWRRAEPFSTSVFDIVARRYDGTGLPLGGEFAVNTYTTGNQSYPAIASDPGGNFVVVWSGENDSYTDIFAQRFDNAGVMQGGEFQVNTYTTGYQLFPKAAVDGAGNATIVWTSAFTGQDGDSHGVFGRRYDGSGVPLGGEFLVNTHTTLTQSMPDVAADAAGRFVVVWQSNQGGATQNVFGQRFDSTGLPLGSEFQINTFTLGQEEFPAVAVDPTGRFLVVWRSQTLSAFAVKAQRYDVSGLAVGGEFQVNSYTTTIYPQYPDVAADGGGTFTVVWSEHRDGSYSGVFERRYDATGLALSDEYQVNTYTSYRQETPSVAADGATNFVTVWMSAGQDGHAAGIFGQRSRPDRLVHARKLAVVDPDGTENRRSVLVVGKENNTETGPTIDGDPTVGGATLRLITHGSTPSDQTFILDAGGWTRLGTRGFRYRGPTGVDGDPVSMVLLQRNLFGSARVKALLRGSVGTQSLDVVPPNSGDDGGVIVQIANGGAYCVAVGGAAGGVEVQDTAQRWHVVRATAEVCPVP